MLFSHHTVNRLLTASALTQLQGHHAAQGKANHMSLAPAKMVLFREEGKAEANMSRAQRGETRNPMQLTGDRVFRKRGKLKRIWAERSAERREIRRNLPETQKRG